MSASWRAEMFINSQQIPQPVVAVVVMVVVVVMVMMNSKELVGKQAEDS